MFQSLFSDTNQNPQHLKYQNQDVSSEQSEICLRVSQKSVVQNGWHGAT